MGIALIGFKGSGKTTYGAHFASLIGGTHLDTDALLLESFPPGTSCKSLYQTFGKDRFLELEHQALLQAIRRGYDVLSTGGGIVLKAENRALLQAQGPIVFLDCPWELVAGRLGDQAPLWASRFSQRKEIYQTLCTHHIKIGEQTHGQQQLW